MEENKLNFFQRVIISIKDFEKYDIFALESSKNSIKYLFTIILIFSLIATLAYGYKIINGGLPELLNEVESELNGELEIDIEEMQEVVEQNYEIFFIVTFFTVLITYFFSTFIDAIMLGILGLIVARIVGMKMQYKAAFNIGVYSLTLPIILQIIYIVVNILFGFEVKYFQWMYATISYIYVVVAILMIKTQFINQQRELLKIQLEQDKVRQEMQEQDNNIDNDEDKNKKNDEEDKTNDKGQEKEEKDNNIGEEPEGTNA